MLARFLPTPRRSLAAFLPLAVLVACDTSRNTGDTPSIDAAAPAEDGSADARAADAADVGPGLDGAPTMADGSTEADGGSVASDASPPDGGDVPADLDAGDIDAGPDANPPDDASVSDDASPDASTDPDGDAGWISGAIRPRAPVVYTGAPDDCPLPAGEIRTPGWSNPMYSGIEVRDRWAEPCRPGDVFAHSVPDSIASWCLSRLSGAATCVDLAAAVADCRQCGAAWVDTVERAGCPLGADLASTIPTSEACELISDLRREGDCRTSCPYNSSPVPLAVSDWCHSWASDAWSCADLNLSRDECHVCDELARELRR